MTSIKLCKIVVYITTLTIFITILSCRTSPKTATSEKPIIPNRKMEIECFSVYDFPVIRAIENDSSHFIILEDVSNKAIYVDIDKEITATITNVDKYSNNMDDLLITKYDTTRYNYKINIELNGRTESYKIYAFSEGWSPLPNTIRSNMIEAFTGEFRVIEERDGIKRVLITKKVKNWLPKNIYNRLFFVGSYKYLIYIDGEVGKHERVYVIEL